MWNVEGPTRRKDNQLKKAADTEHMRKTLIDMGEADRKRKAAEHAKDLAEERQVVENDLNAKELERGIHAFKRQLFAQEMLATWEKQNRYKKNMKIVEDEC